MPCIEIDVDQRGMLEISLIENLQRRDLSPFEEAAALQGLCDKFRYTHDEIARKLGKSRTVITEALSLNRMPEDVRERCRQADIVSKSMLHQIVRQPTAEEMHRLIDKVTGDGIGRDEARQFNREGEPARRRPRRYTFNFAPDDETFQFKLTFNKPEVDPRELLEALERIVHKLQSDIAAGASESAPAPAARNRPAESATRPDAWSDRP